ncbi:FxSxx-COOH system tetratricopeptide repeat protein [Micromonospora sp. CA-244673]|uniref:FxSxx-COOH system tetratricopeptide repeat protein n=1 Tax=Micromonospora sp. CA-244673 TaxID=3239958 RepID=UPI003D90724A
MWNVGPRNPGFAGRESELARLREQLGSGGAAVVQALHGMGGIGKTQLATEFAYRYAAEYDVVWWIPAEQTGLIGEQFSKLGSALRVVAPEASSAAAAHAVKSYLRSRNGWLLIFDNAESADDIGQWLPGGAGHVIITSRHQRWTQLAAPVEIDVLARAESILLLSSHYPMLDVDQAEELAEALGDLPLALVQAASFLAETGMSVEEYRQALSSQAREVLGEGRPISYPSPLAATIALSSDRLADVDPAALAILRLCAFLAPEPVPVELLTAIVQFETPAADDSWGLVSLAAVISKPLARARSVARVGDFGLAKVSPQGIAVHRLVQAILRDQLAPNAVVQLQTRIEAVLSMAEPGDPRDAAAWPGWARLLPHLLATDPAHSNNSSLRDLACRAIIFLIVRGNARPAQRLAEHLYQQWRKRLGPDHPHTLRAATELVWAYHDLGKLRELRPLIEDTLSRQRVALGEDHPDTLRSMSDLAVVLDVQGDPQGALHLDKDVVERRRRVLGDNHPDTLISVSNLASGLGKMGKYEQALRMGEDVLERRRRMLGDDHPDTLTAASGVATTLRRLGRHEQARHTEEEVLKRRRQTLGEDHPDTLNAVMGLAAGHHGLGDFEQARLMEEEVLKRRRQTLGEDHPDTLSTMNGLASTLYSLGEFEQAQRLGEEALERRRQVLGEDHPDTLSSLGGLASTLYNLGEYKQARTMEEYVLERRRRVLGDNHPDTLVTAVNLAMTLAALHQNLNARRLAEQGFRGIRDVLGNGHETTKWAREQLNAIAGSMGGRRIPGGRRRKC